MTMGRPRKPGGRADKKDPRKTTILENNDEAEVPEMPHAADWLPIPEHLLDDGVEENDIEWCEPVKAWWHDIWTSPMASEFVKSDIHTLHVACVYLHEGLNPYYKLSDRLKSLSSFEATIKNFGLTPVSRENLRWAVSQGEQAQNRTNQLRSQAPDTDEGQRRNQRQETIDLYNQQG